jgi:hypothetical protein
VRGQAGPWAGSSSTGAIRFVGGGRKCGPASLPSSRRKAPQRVGTRVTRIDPITICRGSGFRSAAAVCFGVRPALRLHRISVRMRGVSSAKKRPCWGAACPISGAFKHTCMEVNLSMRWAASIATELKTCAPRSLLRRLVPDFDGRGGSVRIGAARCARRQRGRWLRIRFQAPLRRDERCELISWLEEEDRRIG